MSASLCTFNPNANCNGLTQYRTVTGVCNNLQRPYEGSVQTALSRLLPAAYDDGKMFKNYFSILSNDSSARTLQRFFSEVK